MHPPLRRALPRALAVLAVLVALAMGAVLAVAPPAGAHAGVLETDPADGIRLTEAPTSVSVTFTEEVSAELGGLRVLDSDGERVDTGDVTRPAADQVRVSLRPDLPEDTYIATYRVVSADGHPISGSWVFAVGEATSLDIDPASVTPETDTTWERIGDLGRTLTYVGTLLAAGGMVFVAFVLDGTAGTHRLRLTIVVASAVGLVGMLVWTAAQGAVATGLGWDAALDPDVLEIVLRDTMGWALLATTAGLAAIVVATRVEQRAVVQTVGFYGAAAVVVGYALWGHASEYENRWLGVGADLLHTAVAAIWFGGLVMMALLLRSRGHLLRAAGPTSDPGRAPSGTDDVVGGTAVITRPATSVDRSIATSDAAALVTSTGETVARFSQLAGWSVGLLWLAGIALTWLGTGGIDGLTDSSYGRLVLAKAAIVVVVLAVAGWNRRVLVPAIALDAVDAEDDPDTEPDRDAVTARWSTLRRSVAGEAAALVVVLAVTAVLVNTPPAVDDPTSTGSRASQPFDTLVGLEGTDTQMQVNVVPGSAGENDIHISYYDGTGLPADVVESVRLEMSLPERDVEPIRRDAVRAGPGHFTWDGDALAIGGTWRIDVITRVDEFTEVVTELSVPVAP